MNKTIQLFTILTIFVVISCNNKKNDNETIFNQPNDNEAISSIPNDIEIIKDLTIKWNDCLIKQDFQTLTTLYAEQVSLYGKSISKEQAVSNKKDFFKIYPDFNQSITGDIMVVKVTDYQYKVSFPKRSSFKGNTSDVQGYLLFDKVADVWKITNESDDVTDKNISKPGVVEKGEEQQQVNSNSTKSDEGEVLEIPVEGKAKQIAFWTPFDDSKASGVTSAKDEVRIAFEQVTTYIRIYHKSVGKNLWSGSEGYEYYFGGGYKEGELIPSISVYEYDFDNDGQKELLVVEASDFMYNTVWIYKYTSGLSELVGEFYAQQKVILEKNRIILPVGSQGIFTEYIYENNSFYELKLHNPDVNN